MDIQSITRLKPTVNLINQLIPLKIEFTECYM